jgi:hypothetical protein
MVMKKRENIEKKYQPDPHKIIINTCSLLFFSTDAWFLSLRARSQWKKSAKQGFNLKDSASCAPSKHPNIRTKPVVFYFQFPLGAWDVGGVVSFMINDPFKNKNKAVAWPSNLRQKRTNGRARPPLGDGRHASYVHVALACGKTETPCGVAETKLLPGSRTKNCQNAR